MAPRTSIVWLDLDDSPETIGRKLSEHRFSRYPVASESLDSNCSRTVRTSPW